MVTTEQPTAREGECSNSRPTGRHLAIEVREDVTSSFVTTTSFKQNTKPLMPESTTGELTPAGSRARISALAFVGGTYQRHRHHLSRPATFPYKYVGTHRIEAAHTHIHRRAPTRPHSSIRSLRLHSIDHQVRPLSRPLSIAPFAHHNTTRHTAQHARIQPQKTHVSIIRATRTCPRHRRPNISAHAATHLAILRAVLPSPRPAGCGQFHAPLTRALTLRQRWRCVAT